MLRFRRSRLNTSCRGTAQIEFVLAFPIVLIVMLTTIEFCLLLNTFTVMSEAAKEGARYAVVHGSDYSSSTCPHNATYSRVTQYLQNTLRDTSAINVCVSYPDGSPAAAALARVNISVTYAYVPVFKFAGWTSPNITASAAGRIVF